MLRRGAEKLVCFNLLIFMDKKKKMISVKVPNIAFYGLSLLRYRDIDEGNTMF